MADWLELVRRRLSSLALDPVEKDEVQSEVASHLEESCEALRAEGLPERHAVQRALAQVPDWNDLEKKIVFAKKGGDFMQKRLKQLWIPGFLTLILATLFLITLQKQGFIQPRILLWRGPGTILLYAPWLLSLPIFGAVGSYLSSRAGGSRGTVLLASVFPVLALTAAFLLMSPIGLVIERITGRHNDFGTVATTLLRDAIGWLLLPGAALVVGGLLGQLFVSRRLNSRSVASH